MKISKNKISQTDKKVNTEDTLSGFQEFSFNLSSRIGPISPSGYENTNMKSKVSKWCCLGQVVESIMTFCWLQS